MSLILVLAAFATVLVLGPLLLWMAGRRRPAEGQEAGTWDRGLTARSTLACALAFNLTFFIQEVFLVVPKALTPGLRPTLFHNNHAWEGSHPLAALFQGTGAVAILLSGILFALLVRASAGRTATARLMFIWMAYHGLMQSLPQFAVGAVVPANDTGQAMDYLALGAAAKTVLALAALACVPPAALWLGRAFRAVSADTFRIATLPALIAVPLIIPYRVPRETIEVLLPPVLVCWIGIAWIQAAARRPAAPVGAPIEVRGSLPALVIAALALLAFFQLVLRPGIPFF